MVLIGAYVDREPATPTEECITIQISLVMHFVLLDGGTAQEWVELRPTNLNDSGLLIKILHV